MRFSDHKRNRALQVIAQCDGSLTLAALRLGVSVPTLSRWKKAASKSADAQLAQIPQNIAARR